MVVRRGRGLRSIGAVAVACVVTLASIGFVLAQAAPTTTITTTNEFVTGGTNLNGDVAVRPFDIPPTGTSDTGSVTRGRLLDGTINELLDFIPVQNGPQIQGVATVIARGPVATPPPGAPERSTNKYLYMFGGGVGAPLGAQDQIYRSEIAADGTLLPPVAVATLGTARFGAAAVASGNSIYVIGGYSDSGPINSVEVFNIDATGTLASAPAAPSCPNSGDVAAVAVNGYVYAIGGVASTRSPVQANQAEVNRAQIQPGGALGPWSPVDEFLPVPTGGGRAVAVFVPGADPNATDNENAPKFRIYFVGGNVGTPPSPGDPDGDTAGATTNVWYMSINANTNQWIDTEEGPLGIWVSAKDSAGQDVTLRSGRELFGLTITNGYMYVIGGISRTLTDTTLYASVERAPIGTDGLVGQFVDISNPQPRINPGVTGGLGDFYAVSDFNRIWAPFGVDISGQPSDAIWEYDNTPYLLSETAVNDSSLFDGLIDFDGSAGAVLNMRFGVDYGNAGEIWVRFRVAPNATSAFVGKPGQEWSNWVRIQNLPLDPADLPSGPDDSTDRKHLLVLTYVPDQPTPCSNGVIVNPSGMQAGVGGALDNVQYLAYQVLLPGTANLETRLNEITINRQLVSHALPGGFSPGGVPCRPNWALADWGVPTLGGDIPGYTTRVVRLKGVGFPTLNGGETIAFTYVPDVDGDGTFDPAPPTVTPISWLTADGATIDILVEITTPANPLEPFYVYSLSISGGALSPTEPLTLSPALQVFPSLTVSDQGLDFDAATTPLRENIVHITTTNQFQQAELFGENFRSGRVNASGATGVSDDASATGWPDYGSPVGPGTLVDPPFNLNNQFTIVCVTDSTQPVDGIYLSGANADGCVNVGPKGGTGTVFVSGGQLSLQLGFPITTLSGPHELVVRVYNPQINSWYEVTGQTVYVIPYFDVTNVNTYLNQDPTLQVDINPEAPPEWALARRGDGFDPDELGIRVYGYGFLSSTAVNLISGIAYDPADILVESAPAPPIVGVGGYQYFDIDTTVPPGAKTGAHLVNLNWNYDVTTDGTGNLAPAGPVTSVSWQWTSAAPGDREAEAQAEKLGVYVLPPPPSVDSVFGNNCLGSIALLQGHPAELKVNGNGFAVDLPVFPTSTILSVTLRHDEQIGVDVNGDGTFDDFSAVDSLPATSWTVLSDRQLVAYFNVPPDLRAGQLYYLEIVTEISTVVWPAGAPAAPISPLIVVVATPTCGNATRVGSECLYGVPGEEPFQVQITGSNFGYNTTVDFGPGVSIVKIDGIEQKFVYRDDVLIGPSDGNTGNLIVVTLSVAADAAAGARTVTVSNGETCGLDQTCTLAAKFVVVPAPTVSGIQPSVIQQPSLTEGIKIVTIDIYGTNFTPGTTVSIEGITVNNTIFLDSGHVKAELLIEANTSPGPFTVVVTTPSGTTCADGPAATGTITIGVKPEVFCETVTPDQVALCAVEPCAPVSITVTGKGFDGFTQMAIASGNAIYELSIQDETDSATSITGLLTPPAFEGFNYDLLGEQWDIVLRNPSTGAILSCQDNFAIFAGTTITDFAAGEGAPTVCQGAVLYDVVVTGTNFLPNLTTENVSFGPAVQIQSVTYVSPTQLLVDLSITDSVSSIGSHALTITNPLPDGSQATLPNAVIVAPVPTVTGISDGTIAQGTVQPITITGSNFLPLTTVTVTPAGLGVYVTDVVVVSESQITAMLHSDAGSDVRTYGLVVTAPGENLPVCSTYTFSNAIQNIAAPGIIRVDPSTVGAGMQNVNVTITGNGFQEDAQVFLSYEGEGEIEFCEGGSMIYVRAGGGFEGPDRIVVCVNVYENAYPQFIGLEVVNPDGGTAIANDKFSISVANQPTPPSDLSAELFPNGKVTLTFQDNATNETGFVVERSLNGGPWTVVKNIKALRNIGTVTCTLTGLKPGNDYDFRVKAVNKSDGNIASPAAMLNYPVNVDDKITGKPVINVLEYVVDKSFYDGVLIEWSGPSSGDVRSYSILRSTKGGPWVSVGAVDGSVNEFVDGDVVTGTKYSYKIEARNNYNTKVSSPRNITP